ncbi:VOC family protein [Agrobacterium sp. LAD9]|uniref:VOC family protein n=1 Tax=Agrobacterium sp. LAD9 TaxID=2055153 RepID=UPI001864BD92|nr:VOC family protein [Agrobacterium sp. LAD9]
MKPIIKSIDQLGYVVTDMEAAVEHWTTKCGVGPFFLIEHISYRAFTYHGRPTEVDLSLAFSYVGSTQVELILQHNDAPSVYRDLITNAGSGLVHVAEFYDDFNDRIQDLPDNAIVQTSLSHDGVETIYLEGAPHRGSYVEFIKGPPAHKERRRLMQQAATHWDGTRPLRVIDPHDPLAAFTI